MKIDKYIRHLELQKKGLKTKYNNMQDLCDKRTKTGLDPLFEERTETRNKIKETNNKLEFLTNLRRELINNEMQNQKSR
jgi:DNA-dependent RNA polymerase auxiliary subunit epsilon